MVMKKDGWIRCIPYVAVSIACWVLPLPNKITLFVALILSYVLLMIPIVTNLYQIFIMSLGFYFVVTKYTLGLISVYALFYFLYLAINILFLKEIFKEMRKGSIKE